MLGDRVLVVVHVALGDAEQPRRDRQVVGAVGERQVEGAAAAEAGHRRGAGAKPCCLAQPRGAAVAANRRVLHPVQLEQRLRLRVVARGHLDHVPLRTQPLDDRAQDQYMRRRAHVHPDLHRRTILLAAAHYGATLAVATAKLSFHLTPRAADRLRSLLAASLGAIGLLALGTAVF